MNTALVESYRRMRQAQASVTWSEPGLIDSMVQPAIKAIEDNYERKHGGGGGGESEEEKDFQLWKRKQDYLHQLQEDGLPEENMQFGEDVNIEGEGETTVDASAGANIGISSSSSFPRLADPNAQGPELKQLPMEMMPRFKAELRDKKEDQFKNYIVGKEIKGFEKFLGGNAAASRFLRTCKDKLAEAKSMKDTQAESKVISLITKLKSSVLELNAELSEWITYSGGGEGGSPMYSKGSNKENMFLTDQIFSMAAPMDINEETGEVGFVIVQSDGMQKLVTYKAATKNLFLKAFKEEQVVGEFSKELRAQALKDIPFNKARVRGFFDNLIGGTNWQDGSRDNIIMSFIHDDIGLTGTRFIDHFRQAYPMIDARLLFNTSMWEQPIQGMPARKMIYDEVVSYNAMVARLYHNQNSPMRSRRIQEVQAKDMSAEEIYNYYMTRKK